MPTFDDLRHMAREEKGLAVVSTARPNGSVHSSVVNAGVMAHPVTARPAVSFVVFGSSRKRVLLRNNGRASLVFRVGWRWTGVEGPVDVIGPDDPFDGFDPSGLPQLLREVFLAAGGKHDDWDEYDRVMALERRAACFITPERVTGNA